ncbi:MAG: hypothetical protein KFB96_12945 [Thiocapsa sp.]|uniref:helix-turn-helix domain-containing protein n=1 Tax=Thiocapsa sp. TaxID=2024551 RepID=UPI001BCF21C9|nr:helix-turn-helix domain-containing protein [Thiocapsa sp.]QVL46680.1 MAG: hypothetical protein KFB96_12945 [Thiocapsa sp.]
MGGKKKTALDGESRRGSRKGIGRTHYPAESARSQCARLLRHLREHGRIDTREARSRLDIMSPAARVYDLRYKVGVDILSVINPDSRVATYILKPGGADR